MVVHKIEVGTMEVYKKEVDKMVGGKLEGGSYKKAYGVLVSFVLVLRKIY